MVCDESIFLQMVKNTGAIRAKEYPRQAGSAKRGILRSFKGGVRQSISRGLSGDPNGVKFQQPPLSGENSCKCVAFRLRRVQPFSPETRRVLLGKSIGEPAAERFVL
jgi:hypothetical protein